MVGVIDFITDATLFVSLKSSEEDFKMMGIWASDLQIAAVIVPMFLNLYILVQW